MIVDIFRSITPWADTQPFSIEIDYEGSLRSVLARDASSNALVATLPTCVGLWHMLHAAIKLAHEYQEPLIVRIPFDEVGKPDQYAKATMRATTTPADISHITSAYGKQEDILRTQPQQRRAAFTLV